jgi:hypothetical protein
MGNQKQQSEEHRQCNDQKKKRNILFPKILFKKMKSADQRKTFISAVCIQ